MFSFDQIIESRRSIRKYKSEKPSWHLIEDMLRSAASAPSPSNKQPVRFIDIKSKAVRSELYQEMLKGKETFLERLEKSGGNKKIKNRINAYFRFSEFMFSAPYLFAVGVENFESLSDILIKENLLTSDRKRNIDLDISTGLSLKAFLLKGAETGIGTCVLTAPLVYIENVNQIIDKGIRINCFVTAGFPDEKPKPVLKKTVSDIYMEI